MERNLKDVAMWQNVIKFLCKAVGTSQLRKKSLICKDGIWGKACQLKRVFCTSQDCLCNCAIKTLLQHQKTITLGGLQLEQLKTSEL